MHLYIDFVLMDIVYRLLYHCSNKKDNWNDYVFCWYLSIWCLFLYYSDLGSVCLSKLTYLKSLQCRVMWWIVISKW